MVLMRTTYGCAQPGPHNLAAPKCPRAPAKSKGSTLAMVSHATNAWGRVKFKIVDASADAKKPCFEIRYADDNTMHSYGTSYEEAAKYAEGTLQGVVVE